jgi:hypothetical protein
MAKLPERPPARDAKAAIDRVEINEGDAKPGVSGLLDKKVRNRRIGVREPGVVELSEDPAELAEEPGIRLWRAVSEIPQAARVLELSGNEVSVAQPAAGSLFTCGDGGGSWDAEVRQLERHLKSVTCSGGAKTVLDAMPKIFRPILFDDEGSRQFGGRQPNNLSDPLPLLLAHWFRRRFNEQGRLSQSRQELRRLKGPMQPPVE